MHIQVKKSELKESDVLLSAQMVSKVSITCFINSIVSSPNSYVETLIPSVMAFWSWDIGR